MSASLMAAVDYPLEQCPHCGSDANLVAHPKFRYKCGACGRPRIALDARVATTPQTVAAQLALSHKANAIKTLWSILGYALWVGVLPLLLLSLSANAIFDLSLVWSLVWLVPAVIAAVFASLALRQGKRQNTISDRSLEQAWLDAGGHLYRQTNGKIAASELATMVGFTEEQANQVLAEAEVNSVLDGSAIDHRLSEVPPQSGARDARVDTDTPVGTRIDTASNPPPLLEEELEELVEKLNRENLK